MRIIISPAKKMEREEYLDDRDLPKFLDRTEELLAKLRTMTPEALKALWKCNDALTALNVDRISHMDLYRNLSPALFSYVGIQYQTMAPGVLEQNRLEYLQKHLRILSGFYGILKPFDGVVPYRLEMQAKLSVGDSKDLYAFWGGMMAEALEEETDCIVNLASKEYSKAVEPHLTKARFLTCRFVEPKNGGDQLVERATACKMARGQMVRWMAEQSVTAPEQLKEFQDLTYRFSPEHSKENLFVFIKGA